MPLPPSHRSFTLKYKNRVNTLRAKTLISTPLSSPQKRTSLLSAVYDEDKNAIDNAKEFDAIWDTGATNSVISTKVVDECGLKPIGMTRVFHAGGSTENCEVFLVSIFLPNKVVVPTVRVTKGVLAGCDVLIGMDVISQGDFAITHHGGKTTFSFRLPSREQIDFVKQEREAIRSIKIGRNEPCSCGSGKKFKKCCGKQ